MAKYFNANLKFIRQKKGLSQQDLANKIGTDRSTISRWENGEIDTPLEMAMNIAEILGISYYDFFGRDLRFDNAELIDLSTDTVQIPVLGTIKAGIPIEAQQDILEYIEIPKSWLKGDKSFYGLKISGDSMYPKYCENDIVIFEKIEDYTLSNNKDCVVMVNGFDATFKNVTMSENGITLVPLNLCNQDNYQPTFYTKEQIEQLPVKIIGIAREKRTRL